jgi:hypothetical protein
MIVVPAHRSVVGRMLRRNPMAALELHIPAATLPPGSTPGLPQLDSDENQQLLSQVRQRSSCALPAAVQACTLPANADLPAVTRVSEQKTACVRQQLFDRPAAIGLLRYANACCPAPIVAHCGLLLQTCTNCC